MSRLRSQDGFSITEVVVAVGLLAVAATGFLRTTTNGLQLVGTSKERQAAVQVANEWMEEARAVPYGGLALATDTAFEGAGTPDAAVDQVARTYQVPGGDVEALVLEAGATFAHRASELPNGVAMEMYRYVTWVADGAEPQAYKRVTVVVQWDGSSRAGGAQEVVQSTVISSDGVAWTSTTTTVPIASTTTTTTSTSTTLPPSDCSGDVTGPALTGRILAGVGAETGYSSSSNVTLSISADDSCLPVRMAFANPDTSYSALEDLAASKAWQLAPGNGDRTVWIKVVDGAGNETETSASVRVDATKPTTPATFTAEKGNKSVILRWSTATDNDRLSGYRLYAKQANGSFSNLPFGSTLSCTASECTWTHGGLKNKDVWTYYVVAVDAAGNTSEKTAQRTITI